MGQEIATLAGGCFWCLEAVYDDMEGVVSVESGYMGGNIEHPTYEQVCGGKTGHAEVVQITFDPANVSYRDILQVFFAIHDPTTRDRQGNDVGPQYRSVVFYHSDEQLRIAEQVLRESEQHFAVPIVTEIQPVSTFYIAEAYHQEYFRNNPNAGYCAYVVAPKVSKFRKMFSEKLRRT